MADKRISQLIERTDIANNDVLPIVASGATTTNKVTISTIQDYIQENIDLGVTSVGITLGTTGTDVSVSGSPITSSGNITINLPTASATNRGLLSAADWTTFNNKANAGEYVTLGTVQTITAQKTFTTSGSSDTMIISHGSGSGIAVDISKAGNGEGLRVQKTSGSGNAVTITGGNLEAPTIVKTGGTSSQFLKADGSVDSTTYYPNSNPSGFTSNVGTVTSVGLSSATSGVFIGTTPITTSGSLSFTIATASGSQNGLLSSTDWTTFNGKQAAGNYVTLDTAQTITALKTFSTSVVEMAIFNSTFSTGGVLAFSRNGANVGNIGNSGSLTVGILDDLEIRSGSAKKIHLRTDATQFTLSPSGGATLFSANSSTPILILNTTGTNQPSGIVTQQNGAEKWGFGTNFGSGDDSFNVYNYAAATRFLTITSGGNLGIRTPTIGYDGAGYGAVRYVTVNNTSGTGSNLELATGTTANDGYIGAVDFINTSNTGASGAGRYGIAAIRGFTTNASGTNTGGGYLTFHTKTDGGSTGERMRITSGGYLKAANNGGYNNATGTFHELTQNLNGSSSAILTHGGTSDPYGLEVNFTGHDPNNATNYMFGAYKTSGGFVWIYRIFSNGTVSARSDARWKKNIETTRNGYIDDLCKLRVVKYNWYNHEDDAPKELGLIAQEVEEVFPNLIQIDPVIAKREVEQEDGTIIEEEFEDGVSRSIKTSVLPFMLLKAIQEQQAQIEELKTEIDSLKNQIK
jgi:hypothetical protein